MLFLVGHRDCKAQFKVGHAQSGVVEVFVMYMRNVTETASIASRYNLHYISMLERGLPQDIMYLKKTQVVTCAMY